MSQNSYPSPISSTSSTSPINTTSDNDLRPLPESGVQGQATETQRSLHNASAALEAAYNRIRQVRRSLLQLSDRLPDSIMQPGLREHVGPAHDAIILTGNMAEDPGEYDGRDGFDENLESWMLSDFGDSVQRATEAQNSLDQIVEESNITERNIDESSRPFLPLDAESPSLPLRPHLRPISLDPQLSRYRELSLRDDSATALGRRVAAREMAAASGNLPPSENRNNSNLPSFSDYIRAFGRSRRPESGRLNPLVEEALSTAQDTRMAAVPDLSELRRLSQVQGQLSPSTHPPLSPWRQESRRRRSLRPDTRQSTRPSTSDHSGRLSMLSNFSVQNFATPTSSNLSRPLLFEEPNSYTQSPEQVTLDGVTTVEDIPFGRNYVIRRRMNAEGEERVQSINLEWNDEDASLWLMPQDSTQLSESYIPRRRMLSNFSDRTQHLDHLQNVSSANAPDMSTRRRGWARLDPDGNEIPSEEEEELERSRAEYRVQALVQARLVASTASNISLDAQDYSTPSHNQSIGVGLSSPHRRVFRGSVMDSVAHINDSFRYSSHSQWNSSPTEELRSFCANPLPMPLENMILHEGANDRDIVIVMPKHASFAGR